MDNGMGTLRRMQDLASALHDFCVPSAQTPTRAREYSTRMNTCFEPPRHAAARTCRSPSPLLQAAGRIHGGLTADAAFRRQTTVDAHRRTQPLERSACRRAKSEMTKNAVECAVCKDDSRPSSASIAQNAWSRNSCARFRARRLHIRPCFLSSAVYHRAVWERESGVLQPHAGQTGVRMVLWRHGYAIH